MENDEAVVRTAIRIRPTTEEKDENIQIEGNSILDLANSKGFAFDRVFVENDGQETVYRDFVASQVNHFVNGFNCLTMAYGQSGTGKTFSIGLHENNDGLSWRALEDTFDLLKKKYDEEDFEITVSFVEVYNEKIFDLFNESKVLQKANAKTEVTHVRVTSVEEALKLLKTGSRHRHVRSTKLNDLSSRSHAIFNIRANITTYGRNITSALYLVDLAGSEGVKRTGNEGAALAEGNYINQGLLAIGKVLQALSSGSKLIPYRDSVLTQLLQESLNLNSYVTLLGCINISDYQGTMSTIRFAQSAKQIKTNPQVNQILKENGRGKTPFKKLFVAPPLSTIRKPEYRHTICTPTKRQKISLFGPHNNTTTKPHNSTTLAVEEPTRCLPDVAEFFHPNNFSEALQMIRDVPQPADARDSIPSIMNVSTSTAKEPNTPSACSSLVSYSPITRRIENLEALFEAKFQKLYDTIILNQSMAVPSTNVINDTQPQTETLVKQVQTLVREELRGIRKMSAAIDTSGFLEIDNDDGDEPVPILAPEPAPFKVPSHPPKPVVILRRSTRITMNIEKTKQKKLHDVVDGRITKHSSPKKITKKVHKENVFNTIKKGSLKDLKMLGTIGPKTAQQIMNFRQINGLLTTWDDFAKLPIWKGKAYQRFKEANLID